MKQVIILFLLIGCITALYGQENLHEDLVVDSAIFNLNKQLLVFPNEKIYLHTDKPYYITGEKIFFRAYLLDALSNKLSQLSRYIYVELINPTDSVLERLRVRPDENYLFYGALTIPEELPQGIYKIRAYTQYMRNQDENSFYLNYVKISDPQILSIQTETDFQFSEDGKINASLRFINAKTQEVIRQPQSVIFRLNQDRSFKSKPDNEGWFRFILNVPPKAAKRTLYVEMTDDKHISRQYISLPYPEGDFDVSFYPEGGYLIAGQSSNVAFKAVNTAGEALNINGEVIDSKGDTVANFKTFYDGMGDFFISPLLDEHYQAICHSGKRTLKYDLPEIQKNSFALKVILRNDKLWITINKYDSISQPEFYLLIHSGGSAIYAKAWDSTKDFISFNVSDLPFGINHILLLTKDLQTISERLVFILNDDHGLADFNMQKNIYYKREQVQAGIQLKDEEQKPLKGNFSIAVTNDREIVADTTSSILSGILLRSELKGYINNPEYYFQKGNKDAELAADLLMKTHGWTRYAIPDVVRGKLSYPTIPPEMSQKISGTVKSGLLSKPAKNFKVSLISMNTGFFDMTEADDNGRYVFRNFEFPDSTKYFIQALNSKGKGKQMTELYVDEDTFPEIHTDWVESEMPRKNNDTLLLDYVAKADLYYTYENGTRIVHLPEVEVKGIQKNSDKYKSIYYSTPDYSFSEEDITKFGATDIKNLLYRVPGVYVAGNSIRIRMSLGDPLIVIDDMPYIPAQGETAVDILNMLNINDIGKIDVLKDPVNTSIYGMRGGNGVIAIYTKRGETTTSLPSFNIKHINPIGYQLPVEFYSPKYDTQESIDNPKPDLRTTIYWKPNVITDDEGNAKLDFYTADDPATYSVIIEGVSNDGELIHYFGKSSITVK